MENRKNKKGVVLLSIGIVLLLVAGGWYAANIAEDRNAGKKAMEILKKIEEQTKVQTEDVSPVITVDGDAFCGRIVIKKLGIELPVFQNWNSKRLKEAPCRYAGSIDTDDMIIAAHNYDSHFGNISLLEINDEVVFVVVLAKGYQGNFLFTTVHEISPLFPLLLFFIHYRRRLFCSQKPELKYL